MKEKMYYFICTEDCFSVQGENKKELAEIAKSHFKMSHKKNISAKEAETMVYIC